MTDQLTAAGLELDSLTTRIESIKSDLRAAISPTLDLSFDQPDGQFIYIVAERIQAALELLEEIYTILDPDSATGHALTYLCALTGTIRRDATYGTVTLRLTLDAATTVPAGSVANVLNDSSNRWVTDVDVTSVGAGTYDVAATASATGEIQATAGTITVITTPVAGWTAVTNPSDASEGTAEESDTALRLRRELELAASGATNIDAIRANLLQLDGCEQCRVYENDTDEPDIVGRPPHSVEAVVYGSDPPLTDTLVAQSIWGNKAAGIEAWGDDSGTATDEQGATHGIGFSRAVDVKIDIDIEMDVYNDYAGDGVVKTTLQDWGEANYSVGEDVFLSPLIAAIFAVQGIADVTSLKVCRHGGVPAAVGLVIDYKEIAVILVANISITIGVVY